MMEIHIVKAGDTLFAISKRYGVSIDEIMQNNPQINNPDVIFPGDKINIPTGGDERQAPLADFAAPISNGERQPGSAYAYNIPQPAREFPHIFFRKGRSGTKRVALTFDDGPDDKYTPQILDVLKQHDLPATFFLLGVNAVKYPHMVQRIVDEKHLIGNHSWSHADFRTLNPARLYEEVIKTENLLYNMVGLRTSLLRPPYGEVTKAVMEQLQEMDYKVINWSVDSEDWRANNPGQILQNTLKDVTEEAILLFHSAGPNSIAANVTVLPQLFAILRGRGYIFVSVAELLGISAYK